ncbi:MAG: tetratricopeptide repeat protein [Acidobacteria bacterium]|nr:tetratricopeptide repeat protein [Acidobacteriota bacterium]
MGVKDDALRLLEEGNKCHSEGKTDEAIEKYRQSIELHPTADAHTYLGWMLSFKGELDEAIRQCKIAIELDPDFGNPYNDIGVYLMQQGHFLEAESWLRRATEARRYEPRHFPYINLGRVYIAQREFGRAIRELCRAIEVAPKDPAARELLRELAARLNGSFGRLPDSIRKLL